ncbi:MAG: DNA topoisomerase I, partial [Candidatus Aenigmarchaeota archaeon]|nr:DNA topoisomerase I [Candidatus Aenigmarchaeota archaeon]MDI6722727.1 DNA topoisomerase I [Candidatus Aenigmarchaeota archaeon]
EALAESRPEKKGEGKAVWYEFRKGGKLYVTAPAVGHLFTLKQKGKGWTYPAFDVEWIPSFKANRAAAFSQPYFINMENLAKDAEDVIVATDYDDEGEVIGYNILKLLCGRKTAARMRFSTMTKEELIQSFQKPEKINLNQVESGYTRHYMDMYWGVNFTRALTLAIKSAAKRFRILSTGRVQGPTLHMLAKHERKINSFIPKPYWEIEADIVLGKQAMKALYEKGKIWDKPQAEKILRTASVKKGIVEDIRKKIMLQKPPKPYNTTSFLADIYRFFGYSPQQGMSIAESLYQAGLISYPRTSSEKLPPDINYKKIITGVGKNPRYAKDAKMLLEKSSLKPEEGSKTDPAHPAVYPTGEMKKMGEQQQKVYDLCVRRFLACFGDPAKRESQKIIIGIGNNMFFINGKRTIEAGWTALYGKYGARDEVMLPPARKGDEVAVKKVSMLDKKTTPPPRFSQGSVLKEMENRGIGTKATRAQILQILYNRGYLMGKSIEVTELGMQLSDILEKNVQDLVSEKLTRHFEQMMEDVAAGKRKREEVLEEAKKKIEKISTALKKKEKKIGEELTNAVIATQDKQSILGKCLKCGGMLKVHKNWMTKKRFAGCSGYKKGCRVGFPLPREGIIMSTEKECEHCKTPVIQVRSSGRRPFRMCLDPECKTKEEWLDKEKLKRARAESRKNSRLAEKLKCRCGKSFRSKRALTLHEKSHSNDLDKGMNAIKAQSV